MAKITPGKVQWFECLFCGHHQVRAPHCKECGAWRDPVKTKWIQQWSPATMADVIDADKTIACDHCRTPYNRDFPHCPKCSSPTTGKEHDPNKIVVSRSHISKSHAPVAIRRQTHQLQQYVTEPAKVDIVASILQFIGTYRKLLAGALVVLIIIVGFLFASVTHEESMTVQQHQWNTSKEVSYVSTDSGECWENECPQYDRQISSGFEDYSSGDSIEVGSTTQNCPNCGSKSVCGDPYEVVVPGACTEIWEDGVSSTKCDPDTKTTTQDCSPVYFDTTQVVKVYATATAYPKLKIHYEVDSVKTKNEYSGWTVGLNPSPPTYNLNSAAQESFTGVTGAEYKVILVNSEGKQYEYSFGDDINLWLSYFDGVSVTAKVTRLGWIKSIK